VCKARSLRPRHPRPGRNNTQEECEFPAIARQAFRKRSQRLEAASEMPKRFKIGRAPGGTMPLTSVYQSLLSPEPVPLDFASGSGGAAARNTASATSSSISISGSTSSIVHRRGSAFLCQEPGQRMGITAYDPEGDMSLS